MKNDLEHVVKYSRQSFMSENHSGIVKEYQELAVKILVPLDKAINKIHMSETIREVYFALAASREVLIQFVNLPNKYKENEELNSIVQRLLPVLLQMNLILNQMIRWPQKKTFNNSLTFKVIERFITWRAAVESVINDLSNAVNGSGKEKNG
ncbi:MAG: hypothetical protein ACXQS8_03805 [Candidatus Helarchaeales archaeon]